MVAWERFFIAVGALVVVIVVLSQLSQRAIAPGPDGNAVITQQSLFGDAADTPAQRISTIELYGNVALSHGAFGAILAGMVWWFEVPPTAIGIGRSTLGVETLIALGVVLGVILYAGNEASALLLDRLGIEYSEELRVVLAPQSSIGWGILLLVVLPIIAVFEELLFRGVLVGAIDTATGISPWLLAVGSSAIFALGHGIQGHGGILVTGALGLVLAGVFVFTESLFVVVLAHYLVNTLEFVVNEGIGYNPLGR